MEILELIGVPYLKKGKGIHIKKKNRGKFTEYCGGKVTDECIQRAKKSKNPKLRKRATFAANARKWKHAGGGALVPITSFGHLLIHGAMESALSYGIMGLVMGMFNLTASGICSAIIFSFFLSLIFKPKS